MSGYEKQDWSSPYEGHGGYQQQPPHQTQQVWKQQPYGQQQGGYQAATAPPPGYGTSPPGPYNSPQPQQQGYGSPPHPQQQWGGGPEKRHSVCFKFTGTKETILNSQVVDPYGKVPFSVVSDKKHTTVSASDGSTLAVIDWNHSAPPVMHYGGKKLQCKEWIKLNKKEKLRVLHHAGKEYHWTTRNQTVYLEPSDRPGFHILIWSDPTGVAEIEAFQESLIVPGLLEAAIVAVVIMQSNHKLGENGNENNQILTTAISTSILSNFSF